MISPIAINAWKNNAPWQENEKVEQDLIICRTLIEIFNDDFLAERLAFRGGTALHKLYLQPQPRYSEDIDLVQIKAEPIKGVIDKLREILSFLGEPVIRQKANNNTLIFRFVSEIAPVKPIKLKVGINCREHFNILGLRHVDFKMENLWFSGATQINTYSLEELLGTKLRALYQRKKGRDLFDIYRAITTCEFDVENLIKCYYKYMEFAAERAPSAKEFVINMDLKMEDKDFLTDTKALLRLNERFDPHLAYGLLKERIISKFI